MSAPSGRTQPVPWIVALGASGGDGLRDVKALLAALPSPLAAVVMVVLHRPTDRISHLQEVLARCSGIPVEIAREDQPFGAGICYIGEPAAHLTFALTHLAHLVPGGDDAYRNRTVDLLFRSLAEAAAPRVIGVVLSGSLDDGSRGLAAIHAMGGRVMVLTPDRSRRNQMPANAADYDGPMDFIGDAEEIAAEIGRLTTLGPDPA